MPDSIAVTPLQPRDPLQTMSGILGIQQQKQALQTGQYTQQSADARAQTDQRAAQEQARVAAYLSNPANKGKKSDDASDDIMSLAPTTGADYIAKMRQNEATQQAVLSAKNKVNDEVRSQTGNLIRSITDDDDPKSVLAKFDAGEAINPQMKGILDPLRERVQHLPPPGTPGRREGIASIAQMIDGKSGETAGTVDNGPNILPTKTNALGNVQVQPNAAIPKGLAPTQQPGYIAAATGAGARATGTASSDIERGNQVSALVQPSKAAIPLTQQIDDLAEQIHSGKLAASVSKAAAAVGMSADTYARQLLEKDLGQVKAMATASAGSDARAGTILSGYPTAESDPQTIHAAMDLTRGTFRQNVARGELLNKVKTKDPSLQGFQHADDTLTSSQDPLMHEFKALDTKEARTAFYKRHFANPQEAQAFRNKVAGMSHDISQ